MWARLLSTLSAFGLADDTIVVFASDHGDMLGERGLWYKMCFFEWAMRVPLVFWAPGRFAARRVEVLASLVDLMPTLLELGRAAGAARTPGLRLDGESLVPLLEGGEVEERTVLGEYLAEGALAPILMIRHGAHKFIWSEADPPMLFDLARDPDELENLAVRPAHEELVQAFEAEVRRRWDPPSLHAAVLASQRARRLAWQALTSGRQTPWDYQPSLHHGRHYVRGRSDLSNLERLRRFPRPD